MERWNQAAGFVPRTTKEEIEDDDEDEDEND
jgi:hypothetical protein